MTGVLRRGRRREVRGRFEARRLRGGGVGSWRQRLERRVHRPRDAEDRVFSSLLHSAVGLQGQRVTEFNVLRNFKPFSKAAVPLCTLTSNVYMKAPIYF